MIIRTIHKNFIHHRFPLIMTLFIFIALRMPWMNEGEALEFWGSMFIQIVIALFLLYFTQKYAIIRQKTYLPAFFYLLLAGTNPLFFYDLRASVSGLLLLFCFCFLFDTYQNPLSQRKALNFSILLTLGSFYWPPLLLFFPLFWYEMLQIKSLNFKSFCASLIGVAVVGLFLLAWVIYQNDWAVFTQILSDWNTLWNFRFSPAMRIDELLMHLFLGILFILSAIKILTTGISEKTQTKIFLGYLSLLIVIIFIFFFIQNQWEKEWLLILYVPLSMVLARYFTLSNRAFVTWLFLFTMVFFLLKFTYPYLPWIGN